MFVIEAGLAMAGTELLLPVRIDPAGVAPGEMMRVSVAEAAAIKANIASDPDALKHLEKEPPPLN